MIDRFIIYGANGFTGRLVAERAQELGLDPIVAGRNASAIEPLARRLGFEHRVFDLDSAASVEAGIRGVAAVLHCAGPYSRTSRPMVDACLATRTHYLDITGEASVLEAVLSRNEAARAAGIVLLPAVGFDVVPTDCLAMRLKNELPSATALELAFTAGLVPSAGTAKTTVENLHVGQRVRRNGALVSLGKPIVREIPFPGGKRLAMSIPWGDLVTAFHSTRIPNITVYMEAPKAVVRAASFLGILAPLLRREGVIRMLQKQAEKRARGPSERQRRTVRVSIWGRVEDANGAALEGNLEIPEGYELTVRSSLESVKRVVAGEVPPGATTPSLAFGAEFVTSLPGVTPFRVARPER